MKNPSIYNSEMKYGASKYSAEVRKFINEDGALISLEELSDLMRRYEELMEIASNNKSQARIEVPSFEAFARAVIHSNRSGNALSV